MNRLDATTTAARGSPGFPRRARAGVVILDERAGAEDMGGVSVVRIPRERLTREVGGISPAFLCESNAGELAERRGGPRTLRAHGFENCVSRIELRSDPADRFVAQ